MRDISYPFAVGRISVMQKSLLSESDFARIEEAGLEQSIRLLSDLGIGARAEASGDVDEILDYERARLVALVDELSPEKELTDLFRLENDAASIKLLLKARCLEEEIPDSELAEGVFALPLLRNCVEQSNYSLLPEGLGSRLAQIDASLGEGVEPRKLSASVDNAIFAYTSEILAKKHDSFCRDYFVSKIDFINLLSIIRANALGWDRNELMLMLLDGGSVSKQKAADAEMDKLSSVFSGSACGKAVKPSLDKYLESGSASEASRILDAALLDYVKAASGDIFGIAPVVYYYLQREYELKRLRVIFARKRAHGR